MEKYPLQGVAYGASKAAANYIMRKIHLEHPSLTVIPIHPGWVQTDMGNDGAVANGFEEAPVALQGSIDGLLGKIDGATCEETSGKFLSFDGMYIER